MRTDVKILLLENSNSHGEERLKHIRRFDYKVTRLITIPSEENAVPDNDFSIIMVHVSLLRGTGIERLKRIMEKNRDAAIIYMVEEAGRIGLLNDVTGGIYDYLKLPASPPYLKHVIDMAVDRRVRFLLEKYYQRYLENQVNEQLQSLAEQQMKLMHTDKLSSIGQVAAGIIHELNNPLMYMKLNMEMLKNFQREISRLLADCGSEHTECRFKNMDVGKLADKMDNLLNTALKGASNIENLLGNILRFARRPDETMTEFDLMQAISNALNFAKVSMGKHIAIKKEFRNGLPPLRGNPQKLEQVILNLVINASQALKNRDDAAITIKTEKTEMDGKNAARVSVSDNGKGIPADIIDEIFDPFFTTKSKDNGTGLGLSISREIVAEFSGTLDVVSETGKGATFILTVPLANNKLSNG